MALAENKGLLQGDDECHAEVCALHALQKRGVVLENKMAPPGTLPADKAAAVREVNGKLAPHPFVAAVARDCVHEAPEMFARQRDVYEIMESLDARRGTLSQSCRQTAFEGNAASPNPLIFKSLLDPYPYRVNMSAGYVHAPLMYSTPNRTALFKTWFLVFQAKIKDPAGSQRHALRPPGRPTGWDCHGQIRMDFFPRLLE
eukprot:s118_g22.t1